LASSQRTDREPQAGLPRKTVSQGKTAIDVLCVGHAAYDLIFSVPYHPQADEKITADDLIACGGGPAANAAVAVARQGYRSAFLGYLGDDLYGDRHLRELQDDGVICDFIARGSSPTPVSAVLVKPDGCRALVNYRGGTQPLAEDAIDASAITAKVILFDGHEPFISIPLAGAARQRRATTVLDAGSLHYGTQELMGRVDYLVCSEKFACQYGGTSVEQSLILLAERAPTVVITLGANGLIWKRGRAEGFMPAFPVDAVDTTGAGDAFHGVFAACIAAEISFEDALRHASAAGALCCTRMGARPGIPRQKAVAALLRAQTERK
jgi:sulfofructose kinase